MTSLRSAHSDVLTETGQMDINAIKRDYFLSKERRERGRELRQNSGDDAPRVAALSVLKELDALPCLQIHPSISFLLFLLFCSIEKKKTKDSPQGSAGRR